MAARKKAADPQTNADFEINGETLSLDFETLTLGEIEEIELFFGRPMSNLGKDDWATGRGTLLMAYLALKRKHPSTTLDDVRKIEVRNIGEPKSERPTKGSDEPESSGSQS